MGGVLAKAFLVTFSTQWTLYAPAALFRTEKFYDVAGGSTFVLLAWLTKYWSASTSNRQKVITWLITIWGTRLSVFLFYRILKSSVGDRRFFNIRDNPSKQFQLWTMQAIWIYLTMLPTLYMHARARPAHRQVQLPPILRPDGTIDTSMTESPTRLQTRDYVGWSIWAAGFLLEVIADYQKFSFRSNPNNKDRFVDIGLWSISRHPNYLGEILMWTGIYVSASSVIKDTKSNILSLLCSPVFLTLLLTKVSGIPSLEKYAEKTWGSDPLYQSYKKNTPVLLPFPGKW